MAKIVGLVGTMSGRIGNMVYSKKNGITIARSYQPQVANPNTQMQVYTRARLKAASQTAAALKDFGRHFLAAIGNKTNDRGMLVKKLFEISGNPGPDAAAVNGNAAVNLSLLSHNGDYGVDAPVIAGGSDDPITVTYTPGGAQAGEIVTFVVLYGFHGGGSPMMSEQRVTYSQGASTLDPMVVTLPHVVDWEGGKVDVVALVMRSRPSVDNLLTSTPNRAGYSETSFPDRLPAVSWNQIAASGNRMFSGIGFASAQVDAQE